MRAAIYARVSTDEQANSIETQEREGRRFAEARGWHVAEVYRDEGASGAEWVNRPEIGRLLRDVDRKPRPWDVLLVRDQDRLGRDAARTVLAIATVLDAGARVIEYSTGHEAQSDPMARMMVSVRGAFGELERAMIAKRTRDAHQSMARQGRVTGGRVYGYRNVRSDAGVHHEVDPDQANVVRDLFERHAAGESVRALAHDLNRRGIPSPHSRHAGAETWSPSVLHAMLHNGRYLGRIEWGKKRKGYKGTIKSNIKVGGSFFNKRTNSFIGIAAHRKAACKTANSAQKSNSRKRPCKVINGGHGSDHTINNHIGLHSNSINDI